MKEKIRVFKDKVLNGSIVYDYSKQKIGPIFDVATAWIFRLLSPTWWWASCAKKGISREERAKGIIARNYFYLCCSITVVVALGLVTSGPPLEKLSTVEIFMVAFVLFLLPLSRCNEILFAFIMDALDKTRAKPDGSVENRSGLPYSKRIKLALLSYVELIVNYAILYYMMPAWYFDGTFQGVLDAIYYSGVTITTLGYGDFSPTHYLPRLMVVHQVIAGFSLIIVSFAVYAGRGASDIYDKNLGGK